MLQFRKVGAITMMALVDILYMVNLGIIRALQMFKNFVIYVGYKPILANVSRRIDEMGIKINELPRVDVHVDKDKLLRRIFRDGTLGMVESYMDEWWDCDEIDKLACECVKAGAFQKLLNPFDRFIHYLQFDVFNLQTVERAREVADRHYDLANEFFKSFLDTSMNYSCGYWKDAKNLEEAQQNKMELIARKLKLKPGMRVLDIGCGWGGLCKYLAEKYEVEVVGVTISKEGAKEARARCKNLSVEIRLQDYRDVNEVFDRIVSVECLEHVGPKNYRTFFEQVSRCLSADGIFLLHTTGHDNDGIPRREPFTHKYVYPNFYIPNHKDIPKSIDNLFRIEDWHNIGTDFDKTLMAWHSNFVKNFHTISHLFKKPKAFYRMWTFYLLMGAAVFRERAFHLWQIVMTKSLLGGYISVR